MRILLLTTQRNLYGERLDEWLAQLGTDESDTVALVSAHFPKEPLPVGQHIVLRVGSPSVPVSVPVAATDAPAWNDIEALEPSPSRAPEETETRGRLSPDAIRHAVTWRARRVQLTARKAWAAQPALRAAAERARTSTKVNRVVGKVGPTALARDFARRSRRAALSSTLFRDADVVISLDRNSHLAAWQLAQNFTGPHVVATLAAANQFMRDQRQS